MIKRISHIKQFGIFRNYQRSGEILDFKKLNIIYGWNYSGKTTIARIFQCLEKGELHEDYKNCEFGLIDYDDKIYSETNLKIQEKQVRVFNSDFIEKNLKWDGGLFNPILLLGEESIEAEKEIEKKQKKIDRIRKITDRLRTIRERFEYKIENGLTDRAWEIKTKLGLVDAFTKTQLRPIFDSIKNNHSNFIINGSKEKRLLRNATVLEDDKLPKIPEYKPSLLLTSLIAEVKNLVSKIPEFSETIDYFVQNPEIGKWVEMGLHFHENKIKCEYCGNTITQKRKDDLIAHFSEDLRIHEEKLNQLHKRMSSANLQSPQHSERDFYQGFRDDFINASKNLIESIKDYNKQITELKKILQGKKDKPFVPITDLKQINDYTNTISKHINIYNEIVKNNNDNTDKFDENKKSAINTLKYHYTGVFVDEIDLFNKEEKIDLYRNRESNLKQSLSKIDEEIRIIKAQISNAQKGREKLNFYIHRFLGREEIKVDVVMDGEYEMFTLKRENEDAVNLSEGEKTAIAFSFFLTKLLEIENLINVIVYIDDPISSLDSNHIFQINAMLKEFFFHKISDETSWELKCNQLFITTHNFDFFSLLRELPKKSKPQNENELQHSFHFLKRIKKDEAVITKLPDAILKYTSEYHYLFKEIYDFYKSDDKSDYSVLMNMPNAVRRFVELYTYSRLPGNRAYTVDMRAEKLWGTERSKRILKVFHYFSHSNNIERMTKNSELLCDIENAVSDLMIELEKDTMHFEELKKAIQD